MRPGAIGPTQAAAMLDCPEPFLSGLVSATPGPYEISHASQIVDRKSVV